MFHKTYLQNNMPVVMERMPHLRSVALGIWVRVGSRSETSLNNGISHFLEHMFFKGTRKRTAHDIAIEIDALGGELNAFTSKEGTTFYIKVLDEFLEQGLELLTDMFQNSTFPEEEVEREREVVVEEIKMVYDTPDDYIHDLFAESVWGDGGLGQPILGKKKTVRSFDRNALLAHIDKYYGTVDTVVACAGNFDQERLLGLLGDSLGGLRRGTEPEETGSHEFRSELNVHERDLSEVHLCMGVRGIEQSSPKRYGALLINTILGGGISSRLFQEIREKRGLAYSVYSYLSSYSNAGVWGLYAGTGRKKFNEVIQRSLDEMMNLPRSLTLDELERAKAHLKGSLMLGLESTSRRMQNIASQEIFYGEYYSPQKIISKIDAVTLDEAVALAESLVSSGGVALTVLGPVGREDIKVDLP